MIAIIMIFQFLDGLLPAQFLMLGKSVDIIAHLGQQFLLGDTADAGVRLIHAHILDIVQLAEDAQLRKLRNARQEDEAKHWLTIFQGTCHREAGEGVERVSGTALQFGWRQTYGEGTAGSIPLIYIEGK